KIRFIILLLSKPSIVCGPFVTDLVTFDSNDTGWCERDTTASWRGSDNSYSCVTISPLRSRRGFPGNGQPRPSGVAHSFLALARTTTPWLDAGWPPELVRRVSLVSCGLAPTRLLR